MVYPENGILFGATKKRAIKYERTQRNLKCTLPSEKSLYKKSYILWFQMYEFYWKGENFGDSKKINDCQGSGRRLLNLWNKEDFQGSENTRHGTIMVDTFHYTFVQTRECIILRVNPKINHGFWMTMMWNVGSSTYRCTIMVGDVASERDCTCEEQKIYRKSVYLPLSFSVLFHPVSLRELRTAIDIKLLKKLCLFCLNMDMEPRGDKGTMSVQYSWPDHPSVLWLPLQLPTYSCLCLISLYNFVLFINH